jgi:hypothetical protein
MKSLMNIVSGMLYLLVLQWMPLQAAVESETRSHTTSKTVSADAGFHIRQFSRLEDGNLGFKRLYYDLACHESAVQLLTESSAANVLDVALLIRSRDVPCESPSREFVARFNPGRNTLRLVDQFDAVWYCSAWCYDPNSPSHPATWQWVDAFGTSERQAMNLMGCAGWVSGVQCYPINWSRD